MEPCTGLGAVGGVAAESLDSDSNVSGKLGGVAGVLAGVHIELKCPAGWQPGTAASWKKTLRAVSNCQWAA